MLDNVQFQCLGHMYNQTRGVCIGSPMAPALCALTVTVEEHFWHMTHACLLANHTIVHHNLLMIRYVDNRLIILPE